ncbi:MAG TPA: hypothetical protein PKL09_01385 [bacterium]|mgnify:CR=1 FL=1|nr:hypothetical protein [bacterium]HNS33791.1 hypothetical protein [bacterium]HNZ73334.1 hypothetical protein [bacterium]HOH66962.1 hypothetical protein [bacterium]
MKKTIIAVAGLIVLLGLADGVGAEVNSVTPSTNDLNRTRGWAHVNQLSAGIGTTNLQFVSTRGFLSCFEYRTDGDTGQKISDTNYNTNITDGLYPYYCENNSSSTHTFTANHYVEVRMVFGAETDERFDWTRFDVIYPRSASITAPTSSAEVYDLVDFTAYLNDDNIDPIQWTIRQGTCAAGTNTVLGNVDGHNDVAIIDTSDLSHQTFSFTADVSGLALGDYCFIYNPTEDSGETNIRKTVEFKVIDEPTPPPVGPTSKDDCKQDGWKSFTNPSFKNQGQCISYLMSNYHAGKRD